MKTNGILRSGLVASLILNALLAIAISIAFPLKTVETKFVEFRTDGGAYVHVLPMGGTVENRRAVSEALTRKFLVAFEEVLPANFVENQTTVATLGSAAVSKAFNKRLVNYAEANFQRRIEIGRTFHTRPGEVRIEYEAVDAAHSGSVGTRQMVAIISFEYMEQNERLGGDFLNHTGLVITHISFPTLENKL